VLSCSPEVFEANEGEDCNTRDGSLPLKGAAISGPAVFSFLDATKKLPDLEVQVRSKEVSYRYNAGSQKGHLQLRELTSSKTHCLGDASLIHLCTRLHTLSVLTIRSLHRICSRFIRHIDNNARILTPARQHRSALLP
jgi:hypothetical protein